jgi:hypothetical protein
VAGGGRRGRCRSGRDAGSARRHDQRPGSALSGGASVRASSGQRRCLASGACLGLGAGECPTAPVTSRPTSVPPSRSDIEAEITEADERRFRGDHENRADSAATILRWLIGDDDQVPVRGENRGELAGGFGDVVRSATQIASILALARDRQQRAGATGRDLDADPADRRFA